VCVCTVVGGGDERETGSELGREGGREEGRTDSVRIDGCVLI